MLKKPLFVSIFLLLFIGLSDYGYGCHKGPGSTDKKGCDETNHATPVVVYFDDWAGDSIQSDLFIRDPQLGVFPVSSYINEEGVGGIIADEGHAPGGFLMNIQAGGGRSLFIDFGAIVPCFNGGPNDCVTDADLNIVECPFTHDGLKFFRTEQDGTPNGAVCSKLVQATLFERAAFDDIDPEAEVRLLNMETGASCPAEDPDRICGGPVQNVRPDDGGGDIHFRVPKPKGRGNAGWTLSFSDENGILCPPAPNFPDFLSIRALDTDPNLGDGDFGADTWNVGTFNEAGVNTPMLVCLIKDKGDEFIGFFSMSFMYTIEIKPPN